MLPNAVLMPAAHMIADWVEGAPDDPRRVRRARLIAYRDVGMNRYGLGRLCVQVATELTLRGKNHGLDPELLEALIQQGNWHNRLNLAGLTLKTLQDRGVEVTTDRREAELAREEADRVLKTIAATNNVGPSHDDLDLHYGPA
ncbi:hypothetical protein [Streptomyces sp. NPDC059631]|uniref:hypothetical protein n=1 Tax=unclassified Streptomyces TaxID=2593676 RepID=UPI003692B6DB